MYCYSLKIWIVFLQFQTFSGVFAVLSGDVTRHSWNSACLLFGAFKNNLNSIAFCFLCHLDFYFSIVLILVKLPS